MYKWTNEPRWGVVSYTKSAAEVQSIMRLSLARYGVFRLYLQVANDGGGARAFFTRRFVKLQRPGGLVAVDF